MAQHVSYLAITEQRLFPIKGVGKTAILKAEKS
jgi:hypothetical protein